MQDITNRGMPDVLACFDGVTCVIELKYKPDPPTRTTTKLFFSTDKGTRRRCLVSVEQGRQLDEWHKANGKAYVLVGLADCWWLLSVPIVMELNFKGISVDELDLHCLTSGLRRDAGEIAEYIGKAW